MCSAFSIPSELIGLGTKGWTMISLMTIRLMIGIMLKNMETSKCICFHPLRS